MKANPFKPVIKPKYRVKAKAVRPLRYTGTKSNVALRASLVVNSDENK